MSNFKSVLCLLAILLAYGVAGRMDYDDAVMLEQVRQADVLAADVTRAAVAAAGDETRPGVPTIGAHRVERDADASSTASACLELWPSKSR